MAKTETKGSPAREVKGKGPKPTKAGKAGGGKGKC